MAGAVLEGGADVLISAVGKAGFVTAGMVKPGAVVIDVGMNRNQAGKLCGDVDFESVSRVAGYLTPVPGGLGPMTITMLLRSTVLSAQNRRNKQYNPAQKHFTAVTMYAIIPN